MPAPLLPLALIGSIAGGSLVAGTLLGSGTASEAFEDPEDPPETGPIIIEGGSGGGGIGSNLITQAMIFIAILVFGRTVIQEVL